jgi:type IV secretion system protein VirB11
MHRRTPSSVAAALAWSDWYQPPLTLDDYVRDGLLTRRQQLVLCQAISARLNILVGGGAETGKTTFVNALLAAVAESDDRVIVIEQLPELRCTSQSKLEICLGPGVSAQRAITTAIRLRPDRIVVDDIHGDIARDVLNAWHDIPGGIGAVHGESAAHMLEVITPSAGAYAPVSAIFKARNLVTRRIHLCVHLRRRRRRHSISVERVVGCSSVHGFVLESRAAA